MLQTYKAKLNNGVLTWKDEVPESIREGEEVEVIVTVLDENKETGPIARRPFGLAKGLFVVPDDFDAPLPNDILEEFYN
ncbi:MAG TPA: hypothetical protein PKE66_10235 [Pyrinomonadaceae bacterium]|nr:hypothetical protein [Pyrinomonadaceae bacterium]